MRIPFLLLISAALAACTDSLNSLGAPSDDLPLAEQPLSTRPSARRVADLDLSPVIVPARVRVGETLEVRVPVASGGCGNSDTTVVTVRALTATIVPYQRVLTSPDIMCPAVYLVDVRLVRLAFAERGQARVRVVSRTGTEGPLSTVESIVTVE